MVTLLIKSVEKIMSLVPVKLGSF